MIANTAVSDDWIAWVDAKRLLGINEKDGSRFAYKNGIECRQIPEKKTAASTSSANRCFNSGRRKIPASRRRTRPPITSSTSESPSAKS